MYSGTVFILLSLLLFLIAASSLRLLYLSPALKLSRKLES